MLRRGHFIAAAVAFLITFAVLLVVGCSGVGSEVPTEEDKGHTEASKEEMGHPEATGEQSYSPEAASE